MDIIVFDMAHWRLPSPGDAAIGYLEGVPDPADLRLSRDSALSERVAWEPSAEAWLQLEQVKTVVGKQVEIQLWDPIMGLLDNEGPYPIQAHCSGCRVLEEDGKKQAFLVLENIRCRTTNYGYDATTQLRPEIDGGSALLSLGEIYSISW